MKLLIVDDDSAFCRLLERGLSTESVQVATAESAEAALTHLASVPRGHFDLVLLDVTMPGQSGLDLLSVLRDRGAAVPVVFVTSRGATEEKVAGLAAGADDWLVKPFELGELRARIDAVLRRADHNLLEYGDLNVDLARQRATRADRLLNLTPREFELLVLLVRAKGQVVSREQMIEQIWRSKIDPGTNVIDVQLGRLRRKLDRHGQPSIESVRGVGFRLQAAPQGEH